MDWWMDRWMNCSIHLLMYIWRIVHYPTLSYVLYRVDPQLLSAGEQVSYHIIYLINRTNDAYWCLFIYREHVTSSYGYRWFKCSVIIVVQVSNMIIIVITIIIIIIIILIITFLSSSSPINIKHKHHTYLPSSL